MDKTHSSVGASSCERWWNCPGSVNLIATLPPQTETEYAREGTAIHELVALALADDVRGKSDAIHFVGQKAANGIVWNEEHAEAAQVCIDVVKADLEKYPGSHLDIEKQFKLPHIHPDARGTNDACIGVFLKKLIVYDYKFGRGVVVEVEGNKQMMYYGLGAALEGDYDQIELVLIQPRALHRDGPVRRWTISKSDLLAFGAELQVRIRDTAKTDAPLVSGSHCQKYFCPALAVCPAIKQMVSETLPGVFDEAPVGGVRTLPGIECLTPGALRKLLDTIPVIDAYIKAAEAFALATLNNGGKIDGYKLVAKKSNRQWKDEEAVKKKWPKIAVQTIVTVLSPSKVETALAQVMKKKEAASIVAEFCYKPDAGVTLASVDDPREEVPPKLESVFVEPKDDIFS